MTLDREELETIEVVVQARLTVDPGRSENLVEFWVGNCDVTDAETGERLGSIKSGFGSNVTVFDDESREGWTVYADDLWYAVQSALKERR